MYTGEEPFREDPSVEPASTPLWRESVAPLDWLRLRVSPVYWGGGLPRGRGEPVVLVPGFLAGDAMLMEMFGWLGRLGYRPFLSHIFWNTDCPHRTATELYGRVAHARRRTGRKVRLVGHSLGGLLAKSVAQDHPEDVDRVVTLGAPFRNLVRAHRAVVQLWDYLKRSPSPYVGRNLGPSCGSGHCVCPFVANLMEPRAIPVPQFSIYSRRDGVVDWECCLEDDPARNDEVSCSHVGMAFHPEVYRALAHRLAG